MLRFRYGYLLLLSLLLSLSLPCFSQETSPSEMSTIEIIKELQLNLDKRESALLMREEALSEREMNLNAREESLIAIESLSKSLREESIKMSNREYWRGFLNGAALFGVSGFIAGAVLP